MKFYLEEKEVKLKELEEAGKSLICVTGFWQVLEAYKITDDAIYFTVTTFEG